MDISLNFLFIITIKFSYKFIYFIGIYSYYYLLLIKYKKSKKKFMDILLHFYTFYNSITIIIYYHNSIKLFKICFINNRSNNFNKKNQKIQQEKCYFLLANNH